MIDRPLRIAMLAHSTNPRGGVVHAMQLSEALEDLGHTVTLHAPDSSGNGFFRRPRCDARTFPVVTAPSGMTAMVEQRIADYVRHFESAAARRFDLFHAHDGISGNALATLKERGLIAGFVRTVHHVDDFADPRLAELQARAIRAADRCFVVSRTWQSRLTAEWGIAADLTGNGVATDRFGPHLDGTEQPLRDSLGLGAGPVLLSVGGVEVRKNTVRILEAFLQLRLLFPDAQLVIAGGASLLDHGAFQREFSTRLASAGSAAAGVHVVGPLADADMAPLYRLAHALVFPSVREGFGLCVLEAMASGTPVVVSSIAPFTEYLADQDAIWCDPLKPASIADAMALSFNETLRRRLAERGLAIAAAHGWERVAKAHLPAYSELRELAHA
ncbi:MSMEG_0565 family glycosyltransferase [Mesorhizobium sp. J428]|uniref:MSMEG_0565 family glycosyltransferase n=1 Tax=Mesorhizobium sp. J428 TaxID=2898440 RepID=UPI002151EE19|nr:MSMEG_0565 family glycosyltransferase [Mesorhizobium sp. J428]MCR5858101.1 MSMEG_0565 family glycosyltransferase [Mesorhizobium sp. J428]